MKRQKDVPTHAATVVPPGATRASQQRKEPSADGVSVPLAPRQLNGKSLEKVDGAETSSTKQHEMMSRQGVSRTMRLDHTMTWFLLGNRDLISIIAHPEDVGPPYVCQSRSSQCMTIRMITNQ